LTVISELELLQQLLDPVANPFTRFERSAPEIQPFSVYNVISGWAFVIGDQHIGPQYQLTGARSPTLSFHTNDSATLSFSLDGNDPALPFITELVTDIWVYLNGTLMFRGRIGSTTDTLDGQADTYTVQCNAFDYREWLGRQILQPSHVWSWSSVTHAKIIGDLFTYCVNGQSGIHPAFTLDTSRLATTLVNFNITPGTSVKETISTMTGFEWQVFPSSTAGLTLRAISQWYYNLNNSFVMEYGGSVDQVTRTLDTSQYANSTVYTGDMNLAPVQADASGIATLPQGRIGEVVSNSAIVDVTHLAKAASDEAARAQAVVPGWTCHLAPGSWQSPADAWLGDICKFYVKRGRLFVNDKYRITDIDIQVNDDSSKASDVTLTVAKPPFLPPS
jgi:hypothetical protein